MQNFGLSAEIREVVITLRGAVAHVEKLKAKDGSTRLAEIRRSLLYLAGKLESIAQRIEEATR